MNNQMLNVRSYKNTTMKVSAEDLSDVSTANASVKTWVATKVVKAASKAMYVRSSSPVDLRNVNHVLRGRLDPVAPVTAVVREKETA